MKTLDDVSIRSALLDIVGALRAATAAAEKVDLRTVRDVQTREFIREVRIESKRLLQGLARKPAA